MCFRPASPTMGVTCPNCGLSNPAMADECLDCGADLTEAKQAAQEAQAAVAAAPGAPSAPAAPSAPGAPAAPGAPEDVQIPF